MHACSHASSTAIASPAASPDTAFGWPAHLWGALFALYGALFPDGVDVSLVGLGKLVGRFGAALATQPQRNRKSTGLAAVVLLSAAGGGLLSLGGCDGMHATAAAAAAPPAPAVTVAAVEEREVAEWDEFSGRLEAVETVEVRPRVAGTISRVAFTAGSEVREGQILFEIDPRPYQAEVARAAAVLAEARSAAALAARAFVRGQALVDKGAITREDFENRDAANERAAAGIRAAEASLALARLNLEWTHVCAPFSGRVGRAEVTAGNLVQAGGAGSATGRLTTVVSVDPIYASFEADEQSYLRYAVMARASASASAAGNASAAAANTSAETRHAAGDHAAGDHAAGDHAAGGHAAHAHARRGTPSPQQGSAPTSVLLGLANEEGFPHQGTIDFVDNQIDPRTGTVRMRATLSNRERLFVPGLYARVRLANGAKHRALLVSDRAVGTDQDKKFALVLKDDDTLEYRPIQLGRLNDGYRVVTGGLHAGERIVVNGMQHVRPGMKVAATPGPMLATR